ncbi:MAG: exonuclease domain-containing protein [Candidatus Accumulibacter sp.]|uniref:exonuclease domain-containing protein n=1 Tax=Accumulibacter sp. TaxID=2053492 RepID=UPI00287873A3|nr:exonuclease domain-containing protein [Accumulibacter sp.]MDS4015875.1 exonuclease domain-containing protein [Accumulibacter sp.]
MQLPGARSAPDEANDPAPPPSTGVELPDSLVFLDLETSGANLANDRIIEIGLVEVDRQGVREWNVLVNPGIPVSPFVAQLTGIDDAMLSNAPTFAEIARELLERLRGKVLIAHNARFDYSFLKGEFSRLAIDFRMPTLCTVRLSRKLFPEHHRHNLDALVTRHQLRISGNRHRALTDAQLLWELWQCWQRELPESSVENAVAALIGLPAWPPQVDARIIDDLPEAAGAFALYAVDGRLLVAKSCSNIRRHVVAQFATGKRASQWREATRRIDWREAAGEFGAHLHAFEFERSAKASTDNFVASDGRRPLPGASSDLCSWQVRPVADGEFRVQLVRADELDFALYDDLFGLYGNDREAVRALRQMADAHHLCHQHLGLDDSAAGQACAAYRQKNCRGVCIGREAAALHAARLLTAIARWKLKPWPFAGPIVLLERDAYGWREDLHLIDRWRHVCTLHSEEALQARLLAGPGEQPFAPEVYRLVSRALAGGKIVLRRLPAWST